MPMLFRAISAWPSMEENDHDKAILGALPTIAVFQFLDTHACMKTRSYLVFMAAAILIPVLIFSGLGLYLMLKQQRESRLRAMEETVRATALAIDQEIADAEGALRILAHTSFIATNDFRSLHHLMRIGNKTNNTWTNVLDYDGNVIVNTLKDFGTPLPPTNYSWIGQVFDQQKTHVSDLRIGAISRVPVISVDVPVPKSSGKRYVISQTFPVEHFNKFLASRPIPQTAVVGMFDSKGISIARNRDAATLVGKPVRLDLYEASLKQFSGRTRHITREGVAVRSVFTHTERTGWTVAIGVPVAELERAAWQAVGYAGAALATVIALTFLGVLIMVRRLTRAVTIVESAAKTLGAGDIPKIAQSNVAEIDMLQATLHDAGVRLARENAARKSLEHERERLLGSERQARVQAEQQNKAKDEFLAMLGHELRNPLGAVTSALTIMRIAGARPEQVERALTIAQRQADHLARIVDDLLDVGRVMAGKIRIAKETIELAKFVQRCVDSNRSTDQGNHQWSIETDTVWVHADPTRLEQIIDNVLANAIRYTPAGGSIRIRVFEKDSNAVIEVHDTGVGIQAELIPRIFDVFVQGPVTLDRAQGGLGLGLALVKRLLALHGGDVTVQSAGPGLGSTFELTLPSHHSTIAGHVHNEDRKLEVANRHVLVVDDNDEGREMLCTMLSLNGFRVTSGRNGEEALDVATRTAPDAAIIDIGLPDISGYEVARRLKQASTTQEIRLIALTGYGQDEDRDRALEAGFEVHVTKPYNMQALLQLLTN